GGRNKTIFEINSHYSWIPRFAVEIFLKGCVACQLRKPIKQHVVSKPIISLGVMTRLQIDLVDMRTRPDTVTADVVYRWILNCVDHFSKYSWVFPLKNKSAVDVSFKLRELFFLFGPPRILHSDNGKEFVASVITELKSLFPNLCFVRGRPRHPQSQGHWSDGLLPVIYGINTRVSSTTKSTPYEVMFGQSPRSDSEFWKLVSQNGILDEEDLPSPIVSLDDDIENSIDVVDGDVSVIVEKLAEEASSNSLFDLPSPGPTNDTAVTENYFVDNLISFDSPQKKIVDSNTNTNDLLGFLDEIDQITKGNSSNSVSSDPATQAAITLIDETLTSISKANPSSLDQLSPSSEPFPSNSTTLPLTTTANSAASSTSLSSVPRHDLIRKRATDNYLKTANKKMKAHDNYLDNLSHKFNVNDCVGVKIHEADRTNTDSKLLPCLIVEKISRNNSVTFRLACQYGVLTNTFSVGEVVDLKSACPKPLKETDVEDLENITFIEACKLFVRGSVSG
ncbi:unnamed protein product, partial [Didymodactylos carnosus]